MWQRFNPMWGQHDLPTVLHVLTRSAVVASIASDRERRAAEVASLHLRIPVDEWGLLEFESLDSIARRGYEASRARIADWWAKQGARR